MHMLLQESVRFREAGLKTKHLPADILAGDMCVTRVFTAVTPCEKGKLALIEKKFILGAKRSRKGKIVADRARAIHHRAPLSCLPEGQTRWSTQSSKQIKCLESA